MKKNKMMRLASALLVAVLLSTSVISGTYAKYVTSDNAEDTARVAKWGVTVTTQGEETFKNEYDETVLSSVSTEDVVAPGTKNDTGVSFSISGTPEVDTKVTISMTEVKDVFLNGGTYKDYTTGDENDTFNFSGVYNPVVFTLKRNGTLVPECENVPLATIASKINKVEQNYQAGENLANVEGTYVLTWKWVFPDNHDQDEAKETNQKDTLLGNLAADSTILAKAPANPSDPFTSLALDTDYCNTVKFKIAITVTQVD